MSLLAAVLRLGEVCSQGAARPASQKHEGLKLDSLGAGEPEVLPRQYRSCGAAHAKFVKLGIQKSKLKKIAEVTQIHQDERINLVRAVFGQFQHKAAAGGIYKSQNKVVYTNQFGSVDCFDFVSDVHRSLARQKAVGVWSHVCAQANSLLTWMRKAPSRSAVVSKQHLAVLWNFNQVSIGKRYTVYGIRFRRYCQYRQYRIGIG